MAKCCYCGLCTTVCPTECLTMTKTYDYSELDIRNMVYHYTDITPDEAVEKKKDYEEAQKLKLAAKAEAVKQKSGTDVSSSKEAPVSDAEVKKPSFKPVFKPVIKPIIPPKKDEGENENQKQ
jgi:Na+-translocating ferredoxin:NAD+ oxidoreductase RnfC subunit